MIKGVLYRLDEKHLLTEVLQRPAPVIVDSSRTITGATHSGPDSLTRRATAKSSDMVCRDADSNGEPPVAHSREPRSGA